MTNYHNDRMSAIHLRSAMHEFKGELAALHDLLQTAQPQAIAALKQEQAQQVQADKAALAEVTQELDLMRQELKTITAAFQALAGGK